MRGFLLWRCALRSYTSSPLTGSIGLSAIVRCFYLFFFFQAEDGIRDVAVTGVQTCALPIFGFVPLVRKHYRTMSLRGSRHSRVGCKISNRSRPKPRSGSISRSVYSARLGKDRKSVV